MFMSIPERRALFLALRASVLNDPCLGQGMTETWGGFGESGAKAHVPHLAQESEVMTDAQISLQCNVSQGQQIRSGCKMCPGE